MVGRFIQGTRKYATLENHVPAPYLRKSFLLEFLPEFAEISICGLGFYVLTVNGIDITKGLLAPYISNPEHCCYYDKYDIKKYLQKGENVIAVMLGNGMINAVGGGIWEFDKAPWRTAPMLWLSMTASDRNHKFSLASDESFRVHPSPICFDDLRYGEYYDARKEIEGWNLPGYDDSSWEFASAAEAPSGELRECKAEPVVKIAERKPCWIHKSKHGYIYDFGQNGAGLCLLQLSGAESGQKITLRYAEALDADGELDRTSITFEGEDNREYYVHNQVDVYIAKGEKVERFLPHFTYHGFRYAEILGISQQQATENLLTYLQYSSALAQVGDFSCSSDTVNRIFEMVKRTDQSNFFYFPIDCPHREKNGWTGDAVLSAEHMTMLYNTKESFREWLLNIRKSQAEDGRIPGIIPIDKWGYGLFGPAWDKVLFELPYVIYKYTGDTDIIRENADAMMKYLSFLAHHEREDGLLCFGLGDWCQVGRVCDEYDAPLAVTCEISVVDLAKKAGEMFSVIGDTEKQVFADNIYKRERALIRDRLIDRNTLCVQGDTQTGQALALSCGIFDAAEEEMAFANLMRFIKRDGDSFCVGVLGINVLFHVLSRFGQGELAYHMITKKEFPSYGELLERGETTLLETFMPIGKSPGSHNHHFQGDVARWFIEWIAGLEIVNHKKILIHPDFIREINDASASHMLPAGVVSVKWNRIGESVKLDISCPEGVECQVILPDGYEDTGKGMIRKK